MNGVTGRALIDQGAVLSCVAPGLAAKAKARRLSGPRRVLVGFFGGERTVDQYARVELSVGELDCQMALAVLELPPGYDVVLGADFAGAFDLVIRAGTGEVRSRGRMLRPPRDGEGPSTVMPTMVGNSSGPGQEGAVLRDGGVPSQSAAPQSSGVPGQSAAPQSSGVPSQSAAPQSSGVPSQSAAPQSSGVPGQSAAPQSSGVPGQSAAPQSSGVPSQSAAPRSGPRQEGAAPHSGPRQEGAAPHSGPRPGGAAPQRSGPRQEGAAPHSGPRPGGAAPQRSGPRQEGAAPHGSGPRQEGAVETTTAADEELLGVEGADGAAREPGEARQTGRHTGGVAQPISEEELGSAADEERLLGACILLGTAGCGDEATVEVWAPREDSEEERSLGAWMMGALMEEDETESRVRQRVEGGAEFRHMFSESLSKRRSPGVTKFDEEVILGAPTPPPCKPAKMSLAQREAATKIIEEMSAAKLLERYHGSVKCRLLMIEKPSAPGEKKRYRMVIDGRAVSATVKRMVCNGVDLRDLVMRMKGYRRMSKLDLTQAFYQVPLPPEAQDRYTFEGPDGRRWKMTVLSMGSTNSMQGLDAMVADIFHDFIADGTLTKVADDLVIGTKEDDDEAHIRVLEKFLRRAKEHELVFNPRKTRYCAKEVDFAGFRVGNGQVRPLRDNVAALKAMAAPRDKRDVQRFLGTANFYSWMVEGFGELAAPLFRLTGDVPFEWGDTHQQAFEEIKRRMAKVTAMTIPDPAKPFEIHVDASGTGIGGVLQQEQGGRLRPVSFFSRALTVAERRWHIREQEMLAVVDMLSHNEHLLLESEVVVNSDHESLRYMQNSSRLTGRFRRWVDVLQKFRIFWRYVKGEENHADWLSRNPANEATTEGDPDDGAASQEMDAPFRAYMEAAQEAGKAGRPTKPVAEMGSLSAGAQMDANDYQISMLGMLEGADSAEGKKLLMAALGEVKCMAVRTLPADEVLELVRAGYSDDKHLSDIIDRLRGGEKGLGFYIQGGLLFKDSLADGPQLCVPRGPALNRLLHAAHDANAHVGIHATVSALRRFYFGGMRKTVREYVTGCVTCLRSKAEQRKQQGLLVPMPVPDQPWQRVSIDVVGGFPPCQGFTCILTVVDYATKSVQAFPMPDDYDSELVADLLLKYIISRTGPLLSIHSDRGPAFTSDLFRRLQEVQHTGITQTTAYHPEGNGNTEIYNKALVNALRTTLADGAGDADWVDVLPLMVYALNSTVHAGLGMSPFEADYGRPPVQFCDILNPVQGPSPPLGGKLEVSDEISREDLRRSIDRTARQALEDAKALQKKYADEKRREAYKFKVGQRVLISRKALMPHEDREMESVLGRKLSPLFIGPYKIVGEGRNAFRLELPRSMRSHDVVNVKYLRPYIAEGTFGRPDEPPPLFLEGEVVRQPEAIKKYEAKKVKGKRQHLYLVKFVGYTDSHNRWLTADELFLCRDMVERYWAALKTAPPRGALPPSK